MPGPEERTYKASDLRYENGIWEVKIEDKKWPKGDVWVPLASVDIEMADFLVDYDKPKGDPETDEILYLHHKGTDTWFTVNQAVAALEEKPGKGYLTKEEAEAQAGPGEVAYQLPDDTWDLKKVTAPKAKDWLTREDARILALWLSRDTGDKYESQLVGTVDGEEAWVVVKAEPEGLLFGSEYEADDYIMSQGMGKTHRPAHHPKYKGKWTIEERPTVDPWEADTPQEVQAKIDKAGMGDQYIPVPNLGGGKAYTIGSRPKAAKPEERYLRTIPDPNQPGYFIDEYGSTDPTTGREQVTNRVRSGQAPPTRKEPTQKSFADLLAAEVEQALKTGNWDRAIAMDDFSKRPSPEAAQRLGIDIQRSPGDWATYQEMLASVTSPAVPWAGQRMVPYGNWLKPFGGQAGLPTGAGYGAPWTPGYGGAPAPGWQGTGGVGMTPEQLTAAPAAWEAYGKQQRERAGLPPTLRQPSMSIEARRSQLIQSGVEPQDVEDYIRQEYAPGWIGAPPPVPDFTETPEMAVGRQAIFATQRAEAQNRAYGFSIGGMQFPAGTNKDWARAQYNAAQGLQPTFLTAPGTSPYGERLTSAFQGQPVGQARQLSAMGAPAFPSEQSYRNLTPSEREMLQSKVQGQGFPWEDYEEQMRRLWSQTYKTAPFRTYPRVA